MSRQHEAATRRAQLIGRLTEPEVIRGAILVLLALALGLLLWAGYGQKWTGFQSRTLWNWLELVVVPVSLALAAFFLNRAASNRDRQLTSEREFYALLGPLLPQEPALSALRVFILSTLHLLDSRGRGQMLRALYDAGLIKGKTAKIDLQSANLRGADLRDMVFKDVNLSGADLSGADLSGTDLTGAILRNTDLMKAGARYGKTPILSRANLEGTNLTKAKLRRAALDHATLSWPVLEGTDLRDADLREVTAFEIVQFKGVDLRGAKLQGADFEVASFDKRVRWDGALYSGNTKWPADFPPPPEAIDVGEWWRKRATQLRSQEHEWFQLNSTDAAGPPSISPTSLGSGRADQGWPFRGNHRRELPVGRGIQTPAYEVTRCDNVHLIHCANEGKVEQRLAKIIRAFCAYALSSTVNLNVDLDVMLAVLAQPC
jgi:hypothetical protein